MGFGPLTVDRHTALTEQGIVLHVFVAGYDVTRRCFFADDTPGQQIACCYKVNSCGQKYREHGALAQEVFTEDIEIREGGPL
jgi:hypothetical protein